MVLEVKEWILNFEKDLKLVVTDPKFEDVNDSSYYLTEFFVEHFICVIGLVIFRTLFRMPKLHDEKVMNF